MGISPTAMNCKNVSLNCDEFISYMLEREILTEKESENFCESICYVANKINQGNHSTNFAKMHALRFAQQLVLSKAKEHGLSEKLNFS